MAASPDHDGKPEWAALAAAAVASLLALALWLAAEVGTVLTSGRWPAVGPSASLALLIGVVRHPGEPALAWPAAWRGSFPSPALFYGVALGLATLPAVLASSIRRAGRPDRGRWAARPDLRCLRVTGRSEPGRLVVGRLVSAGSARARSLIAGERRSSLVVLGPTQSGKTSGLAVPSILEWRGPVVATSVKNDLVEHTIGWRASCGPVHVYDPCGVTRSPASTWSPLAACGDWQGARRVAAQLCNASRGRSTTAADEDFWLSASAKLLAPLLVAACHGGRTITDVVRWLDVQEEEEVATILDRAGLDEAFRAATASWQRDERTRSSIYATAEMVLDAFADPAIARSALSSQIRPPDVVADPTATLYLCAPTHEQERLRPVFTSLVHEVIGAAVERAMRTGTLEPSLLLVLDEAANIAPIKDLDSLASTAAGHGIQLVTIFQDLAQMQARYGERAGTILSNHRGRLILPGLADLASLDYVSRIVGDAEHRDVSMTTDHLGRRSRTMGRRERRMVSDSQVRLLRRDEAILVYGHLPPARVRLRPWYRDRRLRQRATGTAPQARPVLTPRLLVRWLRGDAAAP